MTFLADIPVPSSFGDKLWGLGPLFYFLTAICILLIAGLAWTTVQLRKAEADRVRQAMERVKASSELEKFIKETEVSRREESRMVNQDARENLKVLTGLSNILDRLGRDGERNATTLREDIKREATSTKEHVTHAIQSLRQHLKTNDDDN